MSDVQYARTLSNGRILKNSPRIGKKNKKTKKQKPCVSFFGGNEPSIS
jgi:hypothetical protein